MLVLSLTLIAKPDAAPALIDLAAIVVEHTRAEPGCIRYDFLQSPHTPNKFVIFELWKSRADLHDHFQLPHFKAFAEQLPALTEGGIDMVTYDTDGPKPA
ncbi:antibiotic biosynthesis monooxygenase [Massilia sp. CCM 8733]|uniref:Antibiotic biosynthesis monooxygenase n=1 Tax=Massilia mucilaginosa TaxID=2609282 RepID=A0ABX0P2K7_9BURK|nr:putative quinol monooxygenase [Massilia mucilaginosa]NHZ93268.1 antibiotic biosynthesis monooxygenase [Massilia mucilaginosa]